MSMTYLILRAAEPELANRLRKRFPATFGGPRQVEESSHETETEGQGESGTRILLPQAA